jgi:hypothetical protein
MAVEVELKVKSGTGIIIGNKKFAIVNNTIDISGIQFSDPGEYVISVITNSPDIENTEFNINIQPEEEVIPQDDTGDKPEEPVSGKRPIIAQIDPPTIKLDPIEFDATDNDSDNSEIASSTGFIPLFAYNNSPIESRYIQKLTIYYEDFVPKCEIIFNDALGLINSPKTTPLNDTKFDVFLNSGSDVLKSIHLKFKLEINQKNKSGTNTITGILDIPDFYKVGFKSYKGTSFESLRKIVKELQLGFNSNIENTNDSMTWRRNAITSRQFMKNILEHSYISDDSFMVGYIDYYWSFNYVDVEKEWKRDISDDVGLISQGISSKSGDEVDKIVNMILTNDKSSQSSPFFITNFVVNNNSTYQSTQKGNFTISKVYDRISKLFLKFNVDSLSSNTKDQVVLKGSPGDKKDLETNYRTSYGGKIDTTNVHQNWSYAVEQNKRNLTNLSNITLQADLPSPNYNLYKFQKVKIKIVNEKQGLSNEDAIDERISGDWIIIDIKFIWNGNSLKQSISCTRKELGKTTEEKQNEIIEEDKSVGNSEINENPSDPTIPNQRFQEGEVYLMEDENGRRFKATIVTVLSNGEDFITTITTDIDLDSTEKTVNTQEQVNENTNKVENLETPPIESPKWNPDELLLSGSFEDNNIIVTWEVRTDSTPGYYEAFVDNENVLSFIPSIKEAEIISKGDALDKFTDLGGVI